MECSLFYKIKVKHKTYIIYVEDQSDLSPLPPNGLQVPGVWAQPCLTLFYCSFSKPIVVSSPSKEMGAGEFLGSHHGYCYLLLVSQVPFLTWLLTVCKAKAKKKKKSPWYLHCSKLLAENLYWLPLPTGYNPQSQFKNHFPSLFHSEGRRMGKGRRKHMS